MGDTPIAADSGVYLSMNGMNNAQYLQAEKDILAHLEDKSQQGTRVRRFPDASRDRLRAARAHAMNCVVLLTTLGLGSIVISLTLLLTSGGKGSSGNGSG
jgi:hypothetical protein